MGNKYMNTELFDKAASFAIKAHSNSERRGKNFPYIIHCMEAAEIVSTITTDQEILAAALLHDTVEDTDVTIDEIRKEFGQRIAILVASESEEAVEGVSLEESWHDRKAAAINRLGNASHDAKIVAIGDKLSNMRAIARDFDEIGDELWSRFHTSDPLEHEWHYRGLADSLSELSYTAAYKEFEYLIDDVFYRANRKFSFYQDPKSSRITVFGNVNGENIDFLTSSLLEDCDYVLDFSRVGDISFSGLRAIINARGRGIRLSITNASYSVYRKFCTSSVNSIINVSPKPTSVNMNEWSQSVSGKTAKTYDSNDNESMLKLYYDFVDAKTVEHEKKINSEVFLMGINTPISGEIVSYGNKWGIEYEKIAGKRSIARSITKEPEKFDEYIYIFANVCKDLHSKICNKEIFSSYKTTCMSNVMNSPYFSTEEKMKMVFVINGIKDADTCIHGSMKLKNVLMTGDKPMFIDTANFAYGVPEFDIGTLYYFTCIDDGDDTKKDYNFDKEMTRKFWESFVLYYYGISGYDEIEELNKSLKPFAGLAALQYGLSHEMTPKIKSQVLELMLKQ